MTRIGFFLESLGFGLVAAFLVVALGGAEDEVPLWLMAGTTLFAVGAWAVAIDRSGLVHPGFAALIGIAVVCAFHLFAAIQLLLYAGVEAGDKPVDLVSGALWIVFLSLVVVGRHALLAGIVYSVVFAMASRLWRFRPKEEE
ncbi:hypothetical protein L2U69_08045 [Zavarzinia compransoris]|uniref:hypothetical protein n=1 Tax=Zavarzinia marina TaxID=2911065 RepID=UPI001F3F09B1|nr:hypothetical protein [Zavarzinia marina]MCF4165589.1 hypothetical protein [Zavarzinia marina]